MREGFSWPNRFAGSLFGLDAATTYDVELFLSDPDGGCAIETLQVTTRAVPTPMGGAPVQAATPTDVASVLASASAGDIIELAAGTYGPITVQNDGTASAPIVLRGGPGVVVNGDVRLDGRSHVIVEGLTVNGQIKFNGATGLAIVGNTVNASADGIAMLTRGENIYVADNLVTGATSWTEDALGVSGNNVGEGIVLTGPGHVIEHNRVSGFRDGISLLEDGGAEDQFSIDILYNDISEAADDGIEADFCFHNCRISHNRLTNTFIALSSQPGLGGPTYFDHNVMYNVILSAFKLQRASVGDLVWHNTLVKDGDALGVYTSDVFSRQQFRNNLMIGHGSGGTYNGYSSGSGRVISLDAADPSVDLDWDAYGNTDGTFTGRLGSAQFDDLAELLSMTSASNVIEVGLDVFAAAVGPPSAPLSEYAPVDLRPDSGAAVVDDALVIEGFNDAQTASFVGSGPDRGALEAGEDLPPWGPRL